MELTKEEKVFLLHCVNSVDSEFTLSEPDLTLVKNIEVKFGMTRIEATKEFWKKLQAMPESEPQRTSLFADDPNGIKDELEELK